MRAATIFFVYNLFRRKLNDSFIFRRHKGMMIISFLHYFFMQINRNHNRKIRMYHHFMLNKLNLDTVFLIGSLEPLAFSGSRSNSKKYIGQVILMLHFFMMMVLIVHFLDESNSQTIR